eukprot:CAMPEP_0113484076 /NCGR_PEP_ID=MMETSP0014_2-20120614/23771_1 /TAXON_ID=2857 /ORGANISM="Nitzschia sp." /LENGTH=257 /DNA_ID=CAMNT_0000377659 /DNA_START=128 /DNA_END=901 /DNA_ORIENTATION=+ /assembly_acc=CAM_ASM_000159
MPSSCCTPSTCCGCQQEAPARDSCMCGCAYLNGPFQVMCAQCLTFAGAWLSFAALGDCAFAEIKSPLNVIPGIDFAAQRVGFITFEGPNGSCYWYDSFNNILSPEDQLQAYWNLLGSGWQQVAVVSAVAAGFAWYFFWYTTSFCCSSQVRGVRYTNGFIMSVLLTTVQGCTFIAYQTGFCTQYGCSFGRSAGFSVGALLCYFFAGVAFFCMSDYPGDRWQPPTNITNTYEGAQEIPPPEVVKEDDAMDPEHIEAQTY